MKVSKKALALGVLGLAVLVSIGASEEGCSSIAQEEPSIEKSGGGAADVAKVGDKLTLKGTTYQVTAVKTAKRVGGQYLGTKANGVFVLIDLSLTNQEKEPATISESQIKLIGGNGNEYSQSTDAQFSIDDAFVILEELQPGVTQKGTLVYDVPKAALNGAVLQVEDFWSDSIGEIKLGLGSLN